MRWTLTDEQQMFQETFRGWLGRAAAPDAVRKWLDTEDPAGFDRQLDDEGWSAVGFAEEVGGQGGDLLESALAAEELARCAAPSGRWTALSLAGAIDPDGVEAAVSGEQNPAVAVDAGRVPGVARAVTADGGRLTGEIGWVVGGAGATRLLVPVHDASGGPVWYAVDAAAEGVRARPRRLLDRSRTVADIGLDGAVAERLEVDGAAVMAEVALRAAVLTAADALGAMERVLDLAVEYAGQRQQFGKPIGSFQAVKHAAATMLVEVEASRGIVYFAAASVAQGHPDRALHAAVAKSQVTAMGARAADVALTVHGAIGYTWEHDLQLFYKRLKLDEKLFGAPAAWNERIADGLRLVSATA
ncbi:acyl-CoA dehydrogenase [Nakamurella sp. YIM 132087]|uniref:Acyl-CoA dehydrogenase n=1 Tax=Nakamurella alba TaxID=2665158 RepID=A0A7K1FEI1_9ACTN|nr:acyl-CoA dehydrogenase family protein [Nakamurella alba]MTD12486.1 acyl-CoA dehydrogenase [Nakamurella alba]